MKTLKETYEQVNEKQLSYSWEVLDTRNDKVYPTKNSWTGQQKLELVAKLNDELMDSGEDKTRPYVIQQVK